MSTRIERAAQLRAQLSAIFAAALPDGDKVIVTSDARVIDKARSGQYGIVLVAPGPRFEFPANTSVTRLAWTVFILTKPGAAIDSFDGVDDLLDALIAYQFPMQSAEPGAWPRPAPAEPMPGYQIVVSDDFINS